PTGLEIRRGNDLIDPVMWNQALPIDGGTYKIVARAPGAPEWSTSVVISNEKDTKSVEVPRLRGELAAAKPAAPGKPKFADPRPADPQLTKAPASAPAAPGKPKPADPKLTKAPAPVPAPAAAEPSDVRLPGDGKTPWYCTESHRVSIG